MSYTYNISVILVNYNGKRYIDDLFQSLSKVKHDNFSFEVVFVDNNSSDGSIEYLQDKYGDCGLNIRIVDTKANLGFAGGNNAGVKECQGQYIVLLNNDTKVDEMWLANLYNFMLENKDVGMANSKLLFYYDFLNFKFDTQDKICFDKDIMINGQTYQADNKFCSNLLCEQERLVCFGHSEIKLPLLKGDMDYTFKFRAKEFKRDTDFVIFGEEKYSFEEDGTVSISIPQMDVEKSKFSLIQNAGSGITETYDGYDIGFCEIDNGKHDETYEINNGCGASIMMKKEDFIKCGMFDERFFMYYEDTDLSFRIKALGKKIKFCPQSLVRHIHTGSSTEWSPFFVYHVYRNKLLFIYKNISKKIFWKYFVKQYIEGVRHRDKMKRVGTIDAYKILKGKKDVCFQNASSKRRG